MKGCCFAQMSMHIVIYDSTFSHLNSVHIYVYKLNIFNSDQFQVRCSCCATSLDDIYHFMDFYITMASIQLCPSHLLNKYVMEIYNRKKNEYSKKILIH